MAKENFYKPSETNNHTGDVLLLMMQGQSGQNGSIKHDD
jgi:hypothetical protein